MSSRPAIAEFIGTFFFVFAAAGAGMLAAPAAGPLATAVAAGLALTAAMAALGHASGGHFNPAVTIGLIAAGRFESARAPLYIAAQVVGGAAAALALSLIAAGSPEAARLNLFGVTANHYGFGRGGTSSAFLLEMIATALFVIVYTGATARKAASGFAPLAIGLGFAALYVVAMPITNGSLNPARSTAVAVFAGSEALSQLWLFWLAPLLGAVIGGVISRALQDD